MYHSWFLLVYLYFFLIDGGQKNQQHVMLECIIDVTVPFR